MYRMPAAVLIGILPGSEVRRDILGDPQKKPSCKKAAGIGRAYAMSLTTKRACVRRNTARISSAGSRRVSGSQCSVKKFA